MTPKMRWKASDRARRKARRDEAVRAAIRRVVEGEIEKNVLPWTGKATLQAIVGLMIATESPR